MKENEMNAGDLLLTGALRQMIRICNSGKKMNHDKEEMRLQIWIARIREFRFEYEYIGDIPHLILYKHSHREKTQMCMFCGEEHDHGMSPSEGHRNPNCHQESLTLPFITAEDGTNLYFKNGYIIKTFEKN